jgi:2-keto-3-deoxy-L-rhamnonate aldolase RhmA
VGPGDPSYAVGAPGRLDDPRYREAIAAVLGACASKGPSPGVLVRNATEAQRHLEMGFRFVGVASDSGFVMTTATGIVTDFRAAAGSTSP